MAIASGRFQWVVRKTFMELEDDDTTPKQLRAASSPPQRCSQKLAELTSQKAELRDSTSTVASSEAEDWELDSHRSATFESSGEDSQSEASVPLRQPPWHSKAGSASTSPVPSQRTPAAKARLSGPPGIFVAPPRATEMPSETVWTKEKEPRRTWKASRTQCSSPAQFSQQSIGAPASCVVPNRSPGALDAAPAVPPGVHGSWLRFAPAPSSVDARAR